MTSGWDTDAGHADEMKDLELSPRDAVTLLRLRATYVVQLLVSCCANDASSTKTMFQRIKDSDVLLKLATMDACVIKGFDAFCEVWTTALTVLNDPGKTFDINQILTACGVPTTVGGSECAAARGGVAGDPGTSCEAPTVFHTNELITFTTCDAVLPADENMALLLELQHALLETARTD